MVRRTRGGTGAGQLVVPCREDLGAGKGRVFRNCICGWPRQGGGENKNNGWGGKEKNVPLPEIKSIEGKGGN